MSVDQGLGFLLLALSGWLLPEEWKLRAGLILFLLGALFIFELISWKDVL